MDNLQYLSQLYTDILISWSCIIDECNSIDNVWKIPTARQTFPRKEMRQKTYFLEYIEVVHFSELYMVIRKWFCCTRREQRGSQNFAIKNT